MKQWSAMLSDELLSWPQVATRPMFGMLGFYRGKKIFAAVPHTRALGAANAVIFKLHAPSPRQKNELLADSKVQWNPMARAGWISLQLESGSDLNQALRWFSRAYQAAK